MIRSKRPMQQSLWLGGSYPRLGAELKSHQGAHINPSVDIIERRIYIIECAPRAPLV